MRNEEEKNRLEGEGHGSGERTVTRQEVRRGKDYRGERSGRGLQDRRRDHGVDTGENEMRK